MNPAEPDPKPNLLKELQDLKQAEYDEVIEIEVTEVPPILRKSKNKGRRNVNKATRAPHTRRR